MLDRLIRWASGLRFPVLLAVTAGLFLFDLAIPDLIPLADEILLGLLTVALAAWRKRRGAPSRGSGAGTVTDRGGSSPRGR